MVDCLNSSRIRLKWMAWAGFGWLWISHGARLLLTWQWTFGFLKMRRTSWSAELLLRSEKILTRMRLEWVTVGNRSPSMETSVIPLSFDHKFHEGYHAIKSRSCAVRNRPWHDLAVRISTLFCNLWWNIEVECSKCEFNFCNVTASLNTCSVMYAFRFQTQPTCSLSACTVGSFDKLLNSSHWRHRYLQYLVKYVRSICFVLGHNECTANDPPEGASVEKYWSL
jgi:hypothetical protein